MLARILGLICILASVGCSPGGYTYIHPDYLKKEVVKDEVTRLEEGKVVAILPFGIFGHLPEEDRSALIVQNFILELEQKKAVKIKKPSESLDNLERCNLYDRFLCLSGEESDAIKKSILLELSKVLESDFLIFGAITAHRNYEIGNFGEVGYTSTYFMEAEMWDAENGIKVWKVEKSVNVNDPIMMDIKNAVSEIPLP